jgi:peptidoglycan/LPS O-acetylase OafA/YrhL
MEESVVLSKVAASMVIVAVSLAVVSSLHLAGVLGSNAGSYNGTAAGIAEAVIGVALIAGAIALRRDPVAGLTPAIAATAFAVAGFVLGLSITARSGYVPDVAYHASVLPILIGLLAVLVVASRQRTRPAHRVPDDAR